MGRWFVIVMLATTSACFAPASEVCSDGTTCPANYQCDVEHHRCLTPEEIAVCDGVAEGDDCTLAGRPGACRSGACEVFYCGDGFVTGNEACDGDVGTKTCGDFGFYATPGLACDPRSCTFDLTGCGGGYCGDQMINGGEMCDGSTNLTCVEIGFDAGSLDCNSACGFSIAECTRFGWTPEALTDVVASAVGGSSPDDEWAVGADGRAMRFTGAFWNVVPTPTHDPLVAVWAIAPDDAWAVGLGSAASVLIHWDGTSWMLAAPPDGAYDDVWAARGDAVFFAARDTGVTEWNGATWTSIGDLSSYHPIAIRGTSASDLWVATDEGPLLHWDGSAWTPNAPAASAVHFIDANSPTDVWVIGNDATDPLTGVIAHYDGQTWTQWRATGDFYNNVASSAPNDAWVASSNGTMRHFDGVAWSNSNSVGASASGLAAISGLISFGPGEVVGVSTLNLAYRYRGQAFGRFPPLGPDPFSANDNLGIWSAAANDVYVVQAHEVWHYDGTAWASVYAIPNMRDATSIWGSGSHDIWVGDGDGNVHHFDGATWTVEAATNLQITALWGSAPGDLWAFAAAGAFHRVGTTWVTAVSLGGRPVKSVAGSSASDIWAITGDDRAWHYDGTAWAEVTTGVANTLLAVATLGPDDVFLSAGGGRLRHLHNGSWTEVAVPALADLAFMVATASDDVIAASQRELFHFDGKQWSPMRTPVEFVPNTPDYIPIAGIEATPGRIDLMLARYRVDTMIRTRPIACRVKETDCHDAVDDDCDGKIDQLDDDCP